MPDPASDRDPRWAALGDELGRRLGPGVPLSGPERATFEGRLGGDLSAVMVHRSPLAGHLARVVDADALTTEAHILGSHAALDAATPHGRALLGHEVTHAVQRDVSEPGESYAQRVESELESEPASASAPGPVDAEELAERVYRRMLDELHRDRERGAWID